MFRLCLITCLAALGIAMPITFELEKTWDMFKNVHGKGYLGDVESIRKDIFARNVRYIHQHNMQADLGKHTYWLGLNEYADWSSEEFVKFMNGYKAPTKLNSTRRASTFLAPENLSLPRNVDWRTQGYVTPVKQQAHCGSCWAFSATGALEGQNFRKTGELVSLSEQNLVDCAEENHGCHGGIMDQAFDYVESNNGIDNEECYPYEAELLECRFDDGCVAATCSGFVDVTQGDELALQQASATVGPISVAIDASHLSFQLYRYGVYMEPKCSPMKLDHGVLLVGYGTTTNDDDYWLVKNSWGPSWGLNGYIQMARNKDNQCGIATIASYPLV